MKIRALDFVVLALTMLLLAVAIVQAAPNGASSITQGKTERYNDSQAAIAIPAMAGNVTALDITGTSITRYWQGYFGNLTGTIVLADATSSILYQWALADPQGEVYASRQQIINWTQNIACANASVLQSEDVFIGSNLTLDGDTVNKTFSRTDHPAFLIGGNQAPITGCRSTSVNRTGTGNGYYEVLLQDNTTSNLIYAAIVQPGNWSGFDNGTHDFQMMVADNGTAGEEYPFGTATTYYFFVELG